MAKVTWHMWDFCLSKGHARVVRRRKSSMTYLQPTYHMDKHQALALYYSTQQIDHRHRLIQARRRRGGGPRPVPSPPPPWRYVGHPINWKWTRGVFDALSHTPTCGLSDSPRQGPATWIRISSRSAVSCLSRTLSTGWSIDIAY